jgi:hypothetical protein
VRHQPIYNHQTSARLARLTPPRPCPHVWDIVDTETGEVRASTCGIRDALRLTRRMDAEAGL